MYCRLISIITSIRNPFRALVTLLISYLLSPPTLQVSVRILTASEMRCHPAAGTEKPLWSSILLMDKIPS